MLPWLLLVVSVATAAYNEEKSIKYWNRLAETNIARKIEEFRELHDGRAPKNIILFIGDGMGATSISVARIYKSERSKGKYEPFYMESFESTGWSKTASWSHHVTDSAAAAVAMTTGMKVQQDSLGLVPGKKPDCSPDARIQGENVAELAILKGLSVGVVTTVPITHATPGATYAKGIQRWEMGEASRHSGGCVGQDIALQLLQFPANEFTIIMGGGYKYLVNRTSGGGRVDGKDVTAMWKELPGKRQFMRSREELLNLKTDDEMKVMGVFADDQMDPQATAPGLMPHLWEMTEKAIRLLQGKKNGYFLMVEGGQIDIWEHQNRIRLQSEELLEFDEAVRRARQMTSKEDTLIIVTADHSHAMAVGEFESRGSKVTDVGEEKKGVAFSHGRRLGRNEAPDRLLHKSPVKFNVSKGFHGGDHVPIYVDGPYSWLFSSTIQNTEIAFLMKYLLCLKTDCVTTDWQKMNSEGTVYVKELWDDEKYVVVDTIYWIAYFVTVVSVARVFYLFYKFLKAN